jgi:hypothetical protein
MAEIPRAICEKFSAILAVAGMGRNAPMPGAGGILKRQVRGKLA